MRRMRILFFLFLSVLCEAGISSHYKKIEDKRGGFGVDEIDFIYLINLDQRTERWTHCLDVLLPYGIFPQRVSGIYGWTLPVSVLNDMSLKFERGMSVGAESVMFFPPEYEGKPKFLYLTSADYGKGVFSGWTVKGTIGCSLTHLSILKDAYDSGYNTIWVLEDDIDILDDPHKLPALIQELDSLVGPGGWDVLYTDYDRLIIDPDKTVAAQFPMYWRPDMPFLDVEFLAEYEHINENFTKIGARMRAHSIIYRRSGLKKILDFYEEHNNFLPYDTELCLVPDIQTYVLRKDIVSVHEVTSDTRCRHFE